MRLVMATKDFMIEGRSFEGFPILLDADGWPLEPVQSFLLHVLIEAGGVESKLTWETYCSIHTCGSSFSYTQTWIFSKGHWGRVIFRGFVGNVVVVWIRVSTII